MICDTILYVKLYNEEEINKFVKEKKKKICMFVFSQANIRIFSQTFPKLSHVVIM